MVLVYVSAMQNVSPARCSRFVNCRHLCENRIRPKSQSSGVIIIIKLGGNATRAIASSNRTNPSVVRAIFSACFGKCVVSSHADVCVRVLLAMSPLFFQVFSPMFGMRTSSGGVFLNE